MLSPGGRPARTFLPGVDPVPFPATPVSAIALEYILFVVYILLGPVVWGFFGFAMIKGRQRMLLFDQPCSLPDPPPPATILIPAKDEGERVRSCLRSALAQDYPSFKVIAVDDRSVDETGRVMDEVAQESPNLKVLHIPHGSLPEGWTGKCHALSQAVKDADGRWLLFVDSDAIIEPHALRQCVALCEAKDVQLFSLMPKLECHGIWESLLVPLAGCCASTMFLVALTNNDHLPRLAFANGQFLMMRKDVYDAIGGHANESIRDKFCEDLAFARMLKPQGRRVRVSWGADLLTVRMYSSLSSIFKGWGRNFYAGSLGKPWQILLAIFFVIVCSFSAYAALGWSVYRFFEPVNAYGAYGWLSAAVVHMAFITGVLGMVYSWSGNSKLNGLFFPISGTMLLGILFKSLKMCITGKVEWRGTSYTHRMSKI
jgi:chlorobactene glucosyltransferase